MQKKNATNSKMLKSIPTNKNKLIWNSVRPEYVEATWCNSEENITKLSRQENPNRGEGAKGDETSGGNDDDDETQMRAHI